jgi:hypothetical protein
MVIGVVGCVKGVEHLDLLYENVKDLVFPTVVSLLFLGFLL